ncbi:MAG: hypothetical protein K6T78_15035 [Alicyclobacillus sp.]|nr:hypothetical protein [Alicyclobacillus sp.]
MEGSEAVWHSPQGDGLPSRRRSRMWFILGGVLVLGFGGLFASLTIQALNIRAHTSSEFSRYVVQHHVGTAELTDDPTGIEEPFTVVHLSHSIPDGALTSEAAQLFQVYNQLDGGDQLELVDSSRSRTSQVVANVQFLPGDKEMVIVEHLSNGRTTSVRLPVKWKVVLVGAGS